MVNGRGKQTITFSKMEQRLVGGSNHLEKYESQWEGLSHILWNKCLKPPTRRVYFRNKKICCNHPDSSPPLIDLQLQAT